MQQAQAQGGSDTVDEFRAAIDYRFTRLQAFYDATNNVMRMYRLAHVELVTEIFNGMMQVFGEDIEYVRISRRYVDGIVAQVLGYLGGTPNDCLNSVTSRLAQNSANFGREFNACAGRANRTMAYALTDIYYPTFQQIQTDVSYVPLLTINALSRGNVFDDNQEILDYLVSQYDVIVMQWLGAVSQLFRWETTRFAVEGNFYNEEMYDCPQDAMYYYSNTNTVLMFEAWDTCRPQTA
jgi:hypothetical protein